MITQIFYAARDVNSRRRLRPASRAPHLPSCPSIPRGTEEPRKEAGLVKKAELSEPTETRLASITPSRAGLGARLDYKFITGVREGRAIHGYTAGIWQ